MKRPDIGRRGGALLLMGTIWSIVGVGLLLGLTDTERDVIHALIPNQIRGVLWLASGVTAYVFAFRKGNDSPGFTALMVMPLVRVASYLWGTISWIISGGTEGFVYGWLYGVLYTSFLGLVYLTGGWGEPFRLRKDDIDGGK